MDVFGAGLRVLGAGCWLLVPDAGCLVCGADRRVAALSVGAGWWVAVAGCWVADAVCWVLGSVVGGKFS